MHVIQCGLGQAASLKGQPEKRGMSSSASKSNDQPLVTFCCIFAMVTANAAPPNILIKPECCA